VTLKVTEYLAKGDRIEDNLEFTRLLTGKRKSRKPFRVHGLSNESAGARTLDLRIKSPLLYQLSYALKVFIHHDLHHIDG
jgi:hypothetical protein